MLQAIYLITPDRAIIQICSSYPSVPSRLLGTKLIQLIQTNKKTNNKLLVNYYFNS